MRGNFEKRIEVREIQDPFKILIVRGARIGPCLGFGVEFCVCSKKDFLTWEPLESAHVGGREEGLLRPVQGHVWPGRKGEEARQEG